MEAVDTAASTVEAVEGTGARGTARALALAFEGTWTCWWVVIALIDRMLGPCAVAASTAIAAGEWDWAA